MPDSIIAYLVSTLVFWQNPHIWKSRFSCIYTKEKEQSTPLAAFPSSGILCSKVQRFGDTLLLTLCSGAARMTWLVHSSKQSLHFQQRPKKDPDSLSVAVIRFYWSSSQCRVALCLFWEEMWKVIPLRYSGVLARTVSPCRNTVFFVDHCPMRIIVILSSYYKEAKTKLRLQSSLVRVGESQEVLQVGTRGHSDVSQVLFCYPLAMVRPGLLAASCEACSG